jgi:hypothetical protein
MSDAPKFEVIDRRKMKADEERETRPKPADPAPAAAEQAGGPRLVKNEPPAELAADETAEASEPQGLEAELPPPPTAQESKEQKAAYDASAQRLEDLIRAQNPAVGRSRRWDSSTWCSSST